MQLLILKNLLPFPPQEEKFEEMIPQNKNASQKVISSPAFDDAPSAPSRENINAILDNYDNINEKMDSFAEESYNSNQIKEENITLVSSPQSFAIEEEVNEVVNSPSQLISGIIPNKIEEIGVLNDENTFDLLDNIKNFDKNSLSHPGNFKDDSLLPSQETIEDEKLMMTEEINKNKGMFSDVKDQLLGASHDNLKNVDTVVKENLPDKYDILSEKGHQEVLKELNDFDSHDLQKVNSPGTVDPQEFLRREVVMKEIEGFSSEKLLKTDTITEAYLPTNEDIKHEMSEIESDIKESKKIYSDVMSEVNYFESSNLKSVDTEESVYLPDKIDLSVERALQGVMEEVKDQSKHLSHIEHIKEPVGPDVLMKEEMNRNDTLDSVVHFDKSNLKHSEVDEKSVLPSVEDIQSERLRNNFTHDVESFEKSSLKSTPVNEKNLLPDSNDIQSEKHHYELLAGIESFPHDELKNSEMKEPISPAKLAKQELVRDSVLQDVETYDKSKLTHSFMEEKGILPSSSDIVEERQHLELLTGIESFDSHHLKASSMREPISPMDLAKHEFAHNAMLAGVESYDKLNLTHSETQEKNILPSSSDILHERERVVLEEGSSKFKPLNPREISEPDHQVFEAKEGFMDPKEMMGDVQMFHSKSRNMSGSSSGSLESSNVKSINSTNPLSAPLTTPLTIDEQQRNSSSDEWVKLDKQSGGDLLG
nr:CDK5 regulatory subunit-associated protein 2-like isoform X1 [Lepeophtheirus salmonis]